MASSILGAKEDMLTCLHCGHRACRGYVTTTRVKSTLPCRGSNNAPPLPNPRNPITTPTTHRRQHLERHFLAANHFLGASPTSGEIFCFHCGDFVYDVEFDLARQVRVCGFSGWD